MTVIPRAFSPSRSSFVVRRSSLAFTLVEMLMAIGILAVGVIAIASMFPVGLTQQRRSQDAIVGPTIAGNGVS